MTRGRDGLVIYLPGSEIFDKTEVALLASGVKLLPTGEELVSAATGDEKKWVVEPVSLSRIAR
jgi:hypothetical protein